MNFDGTNSIVGEKLKRRNQKFRLVQSLNYSMEGEEFVGNSQAGHGGLRSNVGGMLMPGDGSDLEDTGFVDAVLRSFAMIIVSELGDETFIIAAIMAMRHSRSVILMGALAALYIMTILSAMLGFVLPHLLSPKLTRMIATFMYYFFGFRLLYIGYNADDDEVNEEMEEVEGKLKAKKSGWRAELGKIFTPIFVEAFVLTFLAEWGDRSQIATITLSAHLSPVGVIIGGCIGHTICTAIAVFGGKLIAQQISQRTVAYAGSFTFFIFAILNTFF